MRRTLCATNAVNQSDQPEWSHPAPSMSVPFRGRMRTFARLNQKTLDQNRVSSQLDVFGKIPRHHRGNDAVAGIQFAAEHALTSSGVTFEGKTVTVTWTFLRGFDELWTRLYGDDHCASYLNWFTEWVFEP